MRSLILGPVACNLLEGLADFAGNVSRIRHPFLQLLPQTPNSKPQILNRTCPEAVHREKYGLIPSNPLGPGPENVRLYRVWRRGFRV